MPERLVAEDPSLLPLAQCSELGPEGCVGVKQLGKHPKGYLLGSTGKKRKGSRRLLRSPCAQSHASFLPGAVSLQVLQGAEQTAVSWGHSEGCGLGEGDCVSPAWVTHQLEETSALGSCFLRKVSSLILTSALSFLANITDLLPVTGAQGFPFGLSPPSFLGCGWKNQT